MTERDRILDWIGAMSEAWLLFDRGMRTARREQRRGDGFDVLINLGLGCAGRAACAVTVRKYNGVECCECYSWKDVERAYLRFNAERARAAFAAARREGGDAA